MKDVTISRTTGIVILLVALVCGAVALVPIISSMRKDQQQSSANQNAFAAKTSAMENGTYQDPALPPTPAATPPPTPAHMVPSGPPHWTLVTTFQGGIGSPTTNSDTFKVGDRWKMEWTTKRVAAGIRGV